MRKRLAQLFTLICCLYGAAILIYLVGYALLGDENALIGLTANLMPIPLIPALILVVFALVARRWLAVAALIPTALAFVMLYGAVLIPGAPRTSSLDDSARNDRVRQFSLLTFNTFAKQSAVEETLRVIEDADADVIVVQELNEILAARLADDLIAEYPYQFLRPRGMSVTGMGIISRIPFEEGGYWRDNRERWGKQTSWLIFEDSQIALYNMHAMAPFGVGDERLFDPSRRADDIGDMLTWAADQAETMPVIAAGDFNLTDQTAHYRQITGMFRDAHRDVGWGLAPTFPNLNRSTYDVSFPFRLLPPMIRIDYVFHTPDIRALSSRVLPTTGASDHYPVLAELEVTLP